MPKTLGIFDIFDNLDQIKAENIASWLSPQSPPIYLENYLANRLLYPQTLPVSELDLKIDLSILREALRINSAQSGTQTNPFINDNPFLNFNLKKIFIPVQFLSFVGDLTVLVKIFIEGLFLGRNKEDIYQDIWTVVIKGDLDEIVGTVILPRFASQSGILQLDLYGRSYIAKAGGLTVVPCDRQKCQVLLKSDNVKVLGKNDLLVEVYGGKLGIIVDGRVG